MLSRPTARLLWASVSPSLGDGTVKSPSNIQQACPRNEGRQPLSPQGPRRNSAPGLPTLSPPLVTRVSGGPGRQAAYLASSACSQGKQRNQGARPDQRIQETLSGNWVFHRKSMLRARKNAQNWQRLTKIASCRQAQEARAGVQASRVSTDRRTQELPPTLTSSDHPGCRG